MLSLLSVETYTPVCMYLNEIGVHCTPSNILSIHLLDASRDQWRIWPISSRKLQTNTGIRKYTQVYAYLGMCLQSNNNMLCFTIYWVILCKLKTSSSVDPPLINKFPKFYQRYFLILGKLFANFFLGISQKVLHVSGY